MPISPESIRSATPRASTPVAELVASRMPPAAPPRTAWSNLFS
ncbi:MAG: hypothetical protein R3D26_16525 [Cyanobacteriota/Melainabacteria group bacterium]